MDRREQYSLGIVKFYVRYGILRCSIYINVSNKSLIKHSAEFLDTKFDSSFAEKHLPPHNNDVFKT